MWRKTVTVERCVLFIVCQNCNEAYVATKFNFPPDDTTCNVCGCKEWSFERFPESLFVWDVRREPE